MQKDVTEAFIPAIQHLQTLVEEHPQARAFLREFARGLLALTEEAEGHVQPSSVSDTEINNLVDSPVDSRESASPPTLDSNGHLPPQPSDELQQRPSEIVPDQPPVRQQIQEMLSAREEALENQLPTNGRQLAEAMASAPETPEPSYSRYAATIDDELPLIFQRCRLKAEGARWVLERQQRLEAGADYRTEIAPEQYDLIGRAKALPDCYLWMLHHHSPPLESWPRYVELASCFDAAAESVELLDNLLDREADTGEILDLAPIMALLAEAQSALYSAITAVNEQGDTDQAKIFSWLREASASRQILIHRHMRRDDLAMPDVGESLRERIRELGQEYAQREERTTLFQQLFSKLRYHLGQIDKYPKRDHGHDWAKSIEAVESLVESGLPPSNVELRALLLPVVDEIPEALALPKHFDLVLREIDNALAVAEHALAQKAEKPISPTPEVQAVTQHLRGRKVVLIGGELRPHAQQALEEAFELSELVWIEGQDQSYVEFEPQVANAEVDVVLLAIRWSRHGFSDVKTFCDKYDKLLVRLPGGYSPNIVAHHIVDQVGKRLETRQVS